MAAETQTAFISYSREDSEFALRLAEDLKAAGAAVWLDQRDIAPGQRWARAVQDALNGCPCVLVILSPASASSTNVDDEVSFALEEKKTVIPVLYRECRIPFRLRPFQYVDFRSDYSHGLRALLVALSPGTTREGNYDQRLPEKDGDPSHVRKPNKNPAGSSFFRFPVWAKAVIAATAILVISTVLYWAFTGLSRSSKPQTEALVPKSSNSPLGRERGWVKQTSGVKSGLLSVAFATPRSIWAVGGDGTILHSEDDGRTWTQQISGTKASLWSAAFVTAESGWVVGEDGTILHTEDAGSTWKQQKSGMIANPSGFPLPDLHSVAFTTQQSGWAVGRDGVMLQTEDGGKTWKKHSTDPGINFLSVTFVTQRSGWAVGSDGIILHTQDSGETWKSQTSGTSYALFSVFFATPRIGWIVSDLGVVLHTEDAGETWKPQASDVLLNADEAPPPSLRSVSFTTARSGWAVGREGVILRTQDGGSTWTKQASGTNLDLWSVAYATPKSAWAVGHAGTILHWED